MKTVAISGAGSGIGRSTASALNEAGYKIILFGRNRLKLEETLSLLKGEGNEIVVADVSDRDALNSAIKKLNTTSIDAIIANAGIGGRNQYGENDRWDEIIGTNLTGTYYFVNELLPLLRNSEASFKNIVVISSILAQLGVPEHSAYCASKAGLLGLVRSWASEFTSDRILVNAICPGWVETEMAMEGIHGYAQASGQKFEQAMKFQMDMVPLKKMSKPDEIASFIKYLVSEEQVSITGQTFHINNGAITP